MKKHILIMMMSCGLVVSSLSPTVVYAQTQPTANTADGLQSGEGEDLITLNLQDVDIRVLINTVAEVSRKNFVVDPRVKGKVSVISGEQLNSDQLYEVFLSILQVHNFAAVESGSLIKIVPSNIVKQLPTPTEYSPVTEASDAQITQVLKLTHSSVQELIPIIRPLIPPTSHFAAHVPTNTLVVTDNAANIKRVLEIIERIDVPDQRSSVHVVYLQKASSSELAGILNQMVPTLGGNDPKNNAPGAPRLTIQAQQSINALVINASDTDFAMLEAIIEQLDIDRPVEGDVHVIYLKHAKAAELVSILNEVTKTATGAGQEGRPASKLSVQADEATNSLVINADQAEFRTIQNVVNKLDVRRAQVYIETVIAEVTIDQAAELGIELGANPTLVDSNNQGQVLGNINASSAFSAVSPGGLTYNLLDFGRYKFDLLLRALRADSNSNILSTPTILTLDNESAEIVVGQEVPFVTGQFTNNTGTTTTTNGTDANGNTTTNNSPNPFQTIERKDVGLKLNITPQINEGDTIKLDVKQEISSVTNSTVAADLITNRRSVEAVVQVEDGQVVVLGGLIQDDVVDSIEWVPVLGKLPLIGALFRKKTKSAVKRNLMIFLKPRIIRSPEQLSKFSKERYDIIRENEQKGQPDTDNMIEGLTPPVLREYDKVTGDGLLESVQRAEDSGRATSDEADAELNKEVEAD